VGNNFFFFLEEIPMVRRAVFVEKSSSIILDFSKLDRIIILVVTEKFLSISTILKILIDHLLNFFRLHCFRPSFKHDIILNVFKNLIIDMSKIFRASIPDLSILRVVIARPNIIPSISLKLLLFKGS